MERAQGNGQQRETMQKVGVSVRRRCGTLPLPNYYRHLLHIDVRGLALPSEQLPYCPCQRPFSHVSRHMSPRCGQPTTAPDDVRLNDVSADTSMSGHPTTAHTHVHVDIAYIKMMTTMKMCLARAVAVSSALWRRALTCKQITRYVKPFNVRSKAVTSQLNLPHGTKS